MSSSESISESYKFILTPIIFALLINIIIFSLKLNKNVNPKYSKYSKYGYIIGIIWMIIFGFIGYVYYLLYKASNKYFTFGTISIIIYLIFALSYPFLTSGFTKLGNTLNILSLLFAFILTFIVGNEYWELRHSFKILYYLIPLLVWLLFVNIFLSS